MRQMDFELTNFEVAIPYFSQYAKWINNSIFKLFNTLWIISIK